MMAAFAREGGYGAPSSVIHVDSSHPDTIVVPDAQLLFTAHFHRAGPDLILTGHDGRNHIIPGYFTGAHRPALVAPNGAALSPDLVELLAGSPTPNEYAQAGQGTAAPEPIGRVEKVVGTVTVIRNGVAVALNVGDTVYKSDVVQTAAGSSVGIGFPDGSALNLVANTRMALNDYSYDPNSTSNSALFSLVEGGLSFVAGKVAHTGDMKIGTPIATMGIRGTAGWLYEDQVATVTANAGNVTLHFAAVYDTVTNTESTYTLYAVDANGQLMHDANGNLISLATVSSTQNGLVTTLTGNGIGALPNVSTAPADFTQQQFQQEVMPQVINFAVQAIQQFQQQNQQTNPQSTPNSTGSPETPPSNNSNEHTQQLNFNLNNGQTVTITVTENQPSNPPPQNNNPPPQQTQTQSGPQTFNFDPPANSGPQTFPTPPDYSPGGVPGPTDNLTDNSSVPLVVNDSRTINNLTVGSGAFVHVVGSSAPGSLTVIGNTDTSGMIQADSTQNDPTITFNNAVTVHAGGEIQALAQGIASSIVFAQDVTLEAAAGETPGGKIDANGSGASLTLTNGATIGAGAEIEANGAGASVFITGAAGVDNAGTMIADKGGAVTLFNVQVRDSAAGVVEAVDSGSLVSLSGSDIVGGTLETGDPANAGNGFIEVGAGLEATFFDGSTSNGPVTVDAFVQVDDGSNLELLGAINGDGAVSVMSGATLSLSNTTVNGLNVDNFGTVSVRGAAVATFENGSFINENGGEVIATGAGSEIIIDGADNFGTVDATSGGIVSLNGDLINESDAIVKALNDGTVNIDPTSGENDGTIAADGLNASATLNLADSAQDNNSHGNVGAMQALDGGTFTITGSEGQTFDNPGTLDAESGGKISVEVATDNTGDGVSDGGQIAVSGAGSFIDFYLGVTGGTAIISDGGKLEYGWSSDVATTFDGAGTLVLDHQNRSGSDFVLSSPYYIGNTSFDTASYIGTIGGFGPHDTIDLTDVTYSSGEYAVWNQTSTQNGGSGVLRIFSAAGAFEASLNLNGIYTSGEFALAHDSGTGTDVNFNYISFADGQINTNGNVTPVISPDGSALQLTNGGGSEAASWFAANPVSVASSFTASFDYQATPQGGGLADGVAFILQDSSAGLNALGGNGSSLGYGPAQDYTGGTAISPSAAVELNLYDSGGSHIPGTNFATGGDYGSYSPTGNVDFWDTGDTVQVVLSYNGSSLTETLTDLVNGNTYSATYNNVDLAQILGADTAYIGFSAATGGAVSTQTVSDFTFTSGQLIDTWNGTGDWVNDPENWTLGAPPNPGDTAAVGRGAAQINSDLAFDGLTIQNSAEIDVAVTSGAILTLADGTVIDGGTLMISDGSDGEVHVEADNGNASGATFDHVQVDDLGNLQVDVVQSAVTLTLSDGTVVDGGDAQGTLTVGPTGNVEVASGPDGLGAALNNLTVNFNGDRGTITVQGALDLSRDTISGGTIDAVLGAGVTHPIEISVPGFDAIGPEVSASGRFMAYIAATSLPGQGNDTSGDIYLYNVATGTSIKITDTSVSGRFAQGVLQPNEKFSGVPSISDSGRFVVFDGKYAVTSESENGPQSQQSDVLLYDQQTQQIALVQSDANEGAISGDGQTIAFDEQVTVSVNSDEQTITETGPAIGVEGPSGNITIVGDNFTQWDSIGDPALSDDGRFVTFWSTASQITVTQGETSNTFNTGNAGETNAQVYVYDSLKHTLEAVSVNGGQLGDGNSGTLDTGENSNGGWRASISGNGRFVVFQSNAANLVAGVGDANHDVSNIFLYDRQTGGIVALTDANSSDVTGSSIRPAISADGKYVTFTSDESDLPGANGGWQTYMVAIDPTTGAPSGMPELLSTGFAGFDNGQNNLGNSVSDGGGVAAFGGAVLAIDVDNGKATPGDGTITFSGASVVDFNGASDNLTFTMSVQHGTLAPKQLSGLSIVGSNDGSHGVLEFMGSLAAINAALQSGVTYTPSSSGNDSLSMTVQDNVTGQTANLTAQFNPGADDPSQVFQSITVDTGQYDIFLTQQQSINVNGDTTINGTTIDGGLITVASGVTLALDDVTDNGSTFHNFGGTVDFTGSSVLTNADIFGRSALGFSVGGAQATQGSSPGTVRFLGASIIGFAAADQMVTITLSVAHGTLTPIHNENVTGLTIVGNNDGTHGVLEFTGKVSDVNRALQTAGVLYTDNANAPATDTLSMTVTDAAGHSGNEALQFNWEADGNIITAVNGASDSNITLAAGTTLTLDDVVLKNVAVTAYSDGQTPSFQINEGRTLVWAGHSTFGGPSSVIVDNNGHIIHSGALDVEFSQTTLEGSGFDTFNGGNSSSIAHTLVNDGNTIDGYQTFGSLVTIDNEAGSFDADVAGQALVLDTGKTVTNDGTFIADGGILKVFDPVVGAGSAIIEHNGTLELGNSDAQTVTFNDQHKVNDPYTTSTALYGIGDDGLIAGYATDGSAIFTLSGSTFTNYSSSSFGVIAVGARDVNDSADVVGGYYSGGAYGHAFVMTSPGDLTTIDPTSLGAVGAQGYGINDAGTVVGTYTTSAGYNGSFEYNLNTGQYTDIRETGATSIAALAISNNGDVVGNYVSSADHQTHGFLLTAAQQFETLSLRSDATVQGINNSDDIVGYIGQPGYGSHGFLYIDGAMHTFDFAGARDTLLEGINDSGQIVGYYYDNSGIAHGFTTTASAVLGDTLILDNPASFTGKIAGISGSNDVLDLKGFHATTTSAATDAGSYDAETGITTLTVTDSSDHQTVQLELLGDYSNAHWTVTDDLNGGANVFDPPATDSATTSGIDTAKGSLAFADQNSADTVSASATPEGSNYLGTFSVDQPSTSDGNATVSWEFDFTNDQASLSAGQTVTQSYNVTLADALNPSANQSQIVSVTIGGPGNDNFVFAPGIGADTVLNFNPQQDTVELDHFANAQTVQELQSLVVTDIHGDAVLDLGQHDSITFANVTTPQLQQAIQAGHVLLH